MGALTNELPVLAQWLISIAAVAGPVFTAVLALNTYRTARAAAVSAEVAQHQFELAQQPFVCVEWPSVVVTGNVHDQLQMYAEGHIIDASGVPTTLHTARIRTTPAGSAQGNFTNITLDVGGAILYGQHMNVPIAGLAHGQFDTVEGVDTKIEELGKAIARIEVEVCFSAHKRERQMWLCRTLVSFRRDSQDVPIVRSRSFAPSRVEERTPSA